MDSDREDVTGPHRRLLPNTTYGQACIPVYRALVVQSVAGEGVWKHHKFSLCAPTEDNWRK